MYVVVPAGGGVSLNEGLRAFWKGNAVSCLRLFPFTAVHITLYKQIVHLHMDEAGFITQWQALFAGGLAGVAAALTTYPLEVAETRLIAQNSREPTYFGILHTISKIYRNEGLLSLYRGFSLTVLGAFPFSVGCYAVYMNLDHLWQEPQFRFTPLQNLINGCVAAGVAQTLSYPFETVKRKMQAQSAQLPHVGGVDVHFNGMMNCFVQIVRNKGVFSLWNGFTASTVKIIPYFCLLFTCFEMCKQVFLYRNGYIISPLSYAPAPGVDQSLGPHELEEVKRYGKRNFGSEGTSLRKCW
uniref:Solute carrier family 25 member 43 n=1 Tax=Knipowitschia caucasica TaxID=637954 RepID=A0AAV2MKL7_KNICA